MFRTVVSMFVFVILGICELPAQKLWDNLAPGEYEVGFKVLNEYDYSRTYQKNGSNNFGPRPMQIAVWYPGQKTLNNKYMPFGDYCYLKATEETLKPITSDDIGSIKQDLLKYIKSEEMLDSILVQKTRAIKNAKPIQGSFPVVLYAPSLGASAFDNTVICEFLASHGYVVASVASRGLFSRRMTFNSKGAEAQVRDLEFVLGVLHDFPKVNLAKVGTVGYSFGGLSNVILGCRYLNLSAIVCLDGTIGAPSGIEILKSYPYIQPSDLKVSVLNFGGDRIKEFDLFVEAPFADIYFMKLKNLNHFNFSSFNLTILPKPIGITNGYRAICNYTLSFLNHYVKQSSDSFVQLMKEYPKDIFSHAEFKKGKQASPSEEEFIRIIQNDGINRGTEIYYSVKNEFPDIKLFEFKSFRDVGWLFLREGKKEEAIEAFKILLDAYPERAESYRRLGEAFMENGNKKSAIKYLRKALELDPDYSAVKQMLKKLKN